MTERQRKFVDVSSTIVLCALILWAFWSFFQGQVVFDLFANDSERFKDYLANQSGSWAAFVYVVLVMLEVLIAFIPGWFVYPVGGAIFGFTQTVLLVLFGNFVAASISFWIGRKWGSILLRKFITEKNLVQFNAYMVTRGSWAVFFLKINPITSLDIWNYVAGASPMGYWKFSVANIVGITPLVMVSAAFGEKTYQFAPQVLGVLIIVTLFYVVWFIVNLPHKISGKK